MMLIQWTWDPQLLAISILRQALLKELKELASKEATFFSGRVRLYVFDIPCGNLT